MPASKIPLLTLSIAATALLGEHLAIGHDGALAGAGLAMYGLSDTDADIGDQVAIDVLGTSIATAGAAIAEGVALEVDPNGKLITRVGGIVVARSLQLATADGDKLEVLLLPQ